MKTTIIYEDEKTKVVRVDYMGKFLYTRTYVKNNDGEVTDMITVFADGKIDNQ